jgi:hypothetical protein
MRKAISLMMVLVLGVAVMGTSAYAVCPDPDHITPWRYNGDPTPEGDDSGWEEPSSPPQGSSVFIRPILCGLAYDLIVMVVLPDNPIESGLVTHVKTHPEQVD